MNAQAANSVLVADLARIFADHEKRLPRLIASGAIKEVARGRVGLVEAVRAYLADLRGELKAKSGTASIEAARIARAEATQLSLAERRREIIPTEDAELTVDYIAGAINAAITAMPARITRDPRLRRQIDALIFKLRSQIAEEIGKL